VTRLLIPATLLMATLLTACGSAHHATAKHPDPPAGTHAATGSPGPSAGAGAAQKIEFIVTGTAPDGVDVTYHAGSHFGSGPAQINGNATRVPWQGTVTFDPKSTFYFLSAELYGPGTISCKIVAELPGGRSLTVVSGHASGKFSTCSAQASPTDKTGLHWLKD
jgi:hypothetical protein